MQNNRLLHQGVPAIFAWQTVELMKMQIPSYQWEHEGPAFQVALTCQSLYPVKYSLLQVW